ncbi:MAG: hypothetical protein OEW24_04425 [Chloroflexota bacterium]|nr:hypothetical protein [Chloroflexota bacterium]
MPGDPHDSSADQPAAPPPPRRSSGDYRPDLRPMLILAGLLVAVIVGWILLSDAILPPR